jgi:hypothetical protein
MSIRNGSVVKRRKNILYKEIEHLLSRTTITTMMNTLRLCLLSGESDVINIKMSLVDFQLFVLRFPSRKNKDASSSSSSLHVMTFGMCICMYVC